jgi:inner membrane protein
LDNLTHTLVGVLIGESAAHATRTRASGLAADTRRNLFVGVMAIGSNVPDLDFIHSRITDSKLDYLLHHRGHTHTILGALAIGALLYLACEAWCRLRRYTLDRTDRAQLLGIALLASLLHIGLDATNSYGVHPFWPFDNRWYYGDAVFIVEPSFWAACAPLVFVLRSLAAKAFVGLALIAGIVLSFATGMVPTLMSVGLVVLTIAMLAIGKLARPQVALATALLVWFAINAGFAQASAIAHRRVQAIAHESFPDTTLLDVVLTPMPANPACWQVLLVDADAQYVHVRRAMLSIAPGVIESSECPRRGNVEATASLAPVAAVSTPTIAWTGATATSREALIRAVEDDCDAAAFMRFARAPWLIERDSKRILGDARFDFEPELSFAEIELEPEERCMAYVPPWVPPRQELLQ